MNLLALLAGLFFISSVVCVFPDYYPKIRQIPLKNTEDPGEPLLLTEYIQRGKIDEARQRARVNHQAFHGVEHYTGFFTVNQAFQSNLFAWFTPSESDPLNDPVVLWLQGGPGSTSLFGLFSENGPFQMKNEQEVVLRKYSWSKTHNMLYIDNPVGVGYSFTSKGGYARNETQVGKDLYNALQQFFLLFPELQKNEFFVTGESYGGKYIPAIAYTILTNNPEADVKINLKGVAIGNGLIDPETQLDYGQYLYQHGLVDRNAKTNLDYYRDQTLALIKENRFDEARGASDKILSYFIEVTGFTNMYNYLKPNWQTDQPLMDVFIQRVDVRKAIHVGRLIFNNGDAVNENLNADICQSMVPWLVELLNNYRVLLYSGAVDIVVAYPLTIKLLEKLKFSGACEYKSAIRKTWYVNGSIAGFSKVAGNLTDVVVLNAGHMVPTDQPQAAYDLINRFTRNVPFN